MYIETNIYYVREDRRYGCEPVYIAKTDNGNISMNRTELENLYGSAAVEKNLANKEKSEWYMTIRIKTEIMK